MIILTIASCNVRVDKEKLIGKYVWNEGRNDTLRLNSDGTYIYWTELDSGKVLKNSGQWTLNSSGNEIKFNDFSFLTDEYLKGIWYSRIRVRNKEVNLMYASEEDIYFKGTED